MLSSVMIYWYTAAADVVYCITCSGQKPVYATGMLPFFPWLFCNLISYAILYHFLQKPRSQNLFYLLVGFLFCCQTAMQICLFYTGKLSFQDLLMLITCLVCPFALTIRCCFNPPTADSIQPFFEYSVFIIGFCLLVDSGWNLGGSWLIPFISANIILLASMTLSRTLGREILTTHPRGALLALAAAVAVVAAALLLTAGLLKLPYEKGVSAVLLAVYAVFAFIGGYINRALEYLLSLLPQEDAGQWMQDPMAAMQLPEAVEEELPKLDPRIGIGLAIAAGVVAILAILWVSRGKKFRLKNKQLSARGRVRRSKGRFWQMLKQTVLGFVKKIRLAKAKFMHRNSCIGCYLWLTKNAKKCGVGHLPGDTPAEFLNRLESEWPEGHDRLRTLLQKLYEELYGGAPSAPFEAAALRAEFKKHLSDKKKPNKKADISA